METTSQGSLRYELGTILLEGVSDQAYAELNDWLRHDPRTLEWRGEGRHYKNIALYLKEQGIPWQDHARQYERLNLISKKQIIPRSHQEAALNAWIHAGYSGIINLPTGAGKTILAMLCMAKLNRPTLICVPTIDLLEQWHEVVRTFFDVDVSRLGGGRHEIGSITIATYDSAVIHADRLGPKFGFVVFDECHHLPAPGYTLVAKTLIAPFRLGLSATLERADGREELLFDLIGELVYEGKIHELEERTLAPYKIIQIEVDMTPEEMSRYQEARGLYTAFIRQSRIDFSSEDGWSRFIMLSSRSPQGRAAMKAYREQKRLAQAASGKITELWEIFRKHPGERIIVFTDENSFAYRIGREFFVPVLTHHTKPAERTLILESFKQGRVKVIATSKVLNEGVDVPEASVGVVLSGSGTVREHVQRLGRILRHKEGKSAVLYEIISKGTSEKYVNQRRRQHYAYQGSHPNQHS